MTAVSAARRSRALVIPLAVVVLASMAALVGPAVLGDDGGPATARLVVDTSAVQVGVPVELSVVVEGVHDLAGFEALGSVDPTAGELRGARVDVDGLGVGGDEVHDVSMDDLAGRAVLGAYSCAAAGCGSGSAPAGVDGSVTLGTFELVPLVAGVVEVKLGSISAVDGSGRRIPLVVGSSAASVTVLGGGSFHRAPARRWNTVEASVSTTTAPTPAIALPDLTSDGQLNQADLSEVGLEWETTRRLGDPCGAADLSRDLNGDGCVDVVDLQGAANLGLVAAPDQATVSAASAGSTFTVTDTSDANDTNTGNGICRTPAGTCSLRAALQEAQASSGPDTIAFALTTGADGNGTYTIQLTKRLPSLNDLSGGITIDGYTQAGSAVNTDATLFTGDLAVAVRGQGATAFDAFAVTSGHNVIRGLSVYDVVRPFWIYGSTAVGNRLTGNFIGTDPTATFVAPALGDTAHGVHVEEDAPGTVIGGTAPADRNVISGNARHGIGLWHNGTDGTVVEGNIIGLGPLGDRAVPNRKHGLDINFGASGTVVGGTATGARNVIGGNDDTGVEISHTSLTTDNHIVGNFIGTDVTGEAAPAYAANANVGIYVEDGATANVIEGNVIGGNRKGGIQIVNGGVNGVSTANVIRGNFVGVSPTGSSMPNGIFGVSVDGSDTVVGPGNAIAYNTGPGVRVRETDALRNRITRNSIFANTGLGIDLAPLNNANANDPGDADAGPNDLLNTPVLDRATTLRFEGSACPGCTVELFEADGTRPAGSGESFLVAGTADANGAFVIANDTGSAIGTLVTAVAIDPNGNTSEYASNVALTLHNDPPAVGTAASFPVDEGGTTTLTATGSDPEGADLLYGWDLDGNGSFETPGQSVTFSAVDIDGPTSRPVTVRVEDPQGLSATAATTVMIANAAPTATLSAPTSAQEGDAIQVSLTSPTDPAAVDVSAGLRYAFACDGDPLASLTYETASPAPATTCVAVDGPSSQSIRAVVVDDDGGRSDYVAVVEVANVVPTVVLGGVRASVAEGGSFTVSAQVSDPSSADLDALTYAWELRQGTTTLATGTDPTFDVTIPDDGVFVVVLVVSDDGGASNVATAEVAAASVAPVGRILITDGAPTGGTVSVVDLVEPAPADLTAGVHYAFSCSGGPLGGVSYASASADPSNTCYWSDGLDSHPVRVLVIDDDGAATEYSTAVVAGGNQPPSIVVPPSATAPEGGSTQLTVTATDPEGEEITYAWDLDGNGSFETPGQAVTFSSADYDGPTSAPVAARATDAGGVSSSVTTTVQVTNEAPEAIVADVAATEGSSVVIAPTGIVDAPGDLATLHYAFSCDGASLGAVTYATASPAASTSCSYDDGPSFHTVRSRLLDDDGGVLDLTTTVLVANAAPVVNIAPLAPDAVEGDTRTFSATAVDPGSIDDAAGLGISWVLRLDGVMVASGGGLSGTLALPDDGTYSLSVSAIDKDGATGTATATLVVAGAAPTATPSAPTSVVEGNAVLLALTSPVEPSPTDVSAGLRYAFSCTGESLAGSTTWASASTVATTTCTAPDGPGSASYTLLVVDADGAATEYTQVVTITSAAPIATFRAPTDVVAGQPVDVSVDHVVDPSPTDTAAGFTYRFDCGTGFGGASSSAAVACPAVGGPTRTLRVEIADEDGAARTYTAVVVVHANLLANPGFELDANADGKPDGWTWPASNTRSPIAHTGSWSASQTSTATKATTTAQVLPSVVRSRYRFSAWVDAPVGGTRSVTVRVRWLDAGGAVLSTTAATTLTEPTAGWQEVAKTVMAPAGAASAKLEIAVTTAGGAVVRVDDAALALDNQLINPGMDIDANADGRPDTWFSLSRFVLSSTTAHSGTISAAAVGDGAGFVPGQRVDRVVAGRTYFASVWLEVPATTDTFSVKLRVRWFDAAGVAMTVPVVATVNASTPGWVQAAGSLVAPAGASAAALELAMSSLEVTMHVDDASFGPA